MAKANDTQVGGSHYKTDGKPEHWDLVAMYNWDYFQGQVTKYLMRWKVKHKTPRERLQDLEKALHFLEKYVEVERLRLKTNALEPAPVVEEKVNHTFSRYEENSPTYLGDEKFLHECSWDDGMNLYTCKHCRTLVRARSLTAAYCIHQCSSDGGPTGGYVSQ